MAFIDTGPAAVARLASDTATAVTVRSSTHAPRVPIAPGRAWPIELRTPSPSHENGRECEKSGLVEALLERERYGSILEIGCGDGGFGRLVVGHRCASYVGMDTDAAALAVARCRVRAGAPMRFLPLVVPFALPPGEHELVVVSDVPRCLGRGAVDTIARRLAEHAPCRELVVVGNRDDHEPAFERFAAALGGRVVHRELARRRHYRIDALLRDAT